MYIFAAGLAALGSRFLRRWPGIISLMLIGAALATRSCWGEEPAEAPPQAPELVGIAQWINSEETNLAKYQGKVVVLHFWTFGCINCRRNLPYYNRWQQDFRPAEVRIIGIHTPEGAAESDLENVAARVKKLKIKYPVAVDNEGATWKAYQNRYWPTVYLIDKQGRVRFRWEGELDYQHAGGDKIVREKIKALAAEKNE